jgi:hypothetical protein
MKTYVATFRSYQGHDQRERLLVRVVGCRSYDRISEPVAHPNQMNHIQCKVWFIGSPDRSKTCAARAQILSGWVLESFAAATGSEADGYAEKVEAGRLAAFAEADAANSRYVASKTVPRDAGSEVEP